MDDLAAGGVVPVRGVAADAARLLPAPGLDLDPAVASTVGGERLHGVVPGEDDERPVLDLPDHEGAVLPVPAQALHDGLDVAPLGVAGERGELVQGNGGGADVAGADVNDQNDVVAK
ncbi:hypothetical protein [Streptomyces sp. NPDC056549]|uniref:hypothetical protein n=1 Tax=Streptomyces sp. NPDC056549 TaxID=3345864 RepID=UPI0036A41116